MLILMSLNFLTSRASYIIDPDTGVKQGLKVRVLFLNLESDQKYYEMIMIGRRVVFGIHIRCCWLQVIQIANKVSGVSIMNNERLDVGKNRNQSQEKIDSVSCVC